MGYDCCAVGSFGVERIQIAHMVSPHDTFSYWGVLSASVKTMSSFGFSSPKCIISVVGSRLLFSVACHNERTVALAWSRSVRKCLGEHSVTRLTEAFGWGGRANTIIQHRKIQLYIFVEKFGPQPSCENRIFAWGKLEYKLIHVLCPLK